MTIIIGFLFMILMFALVGTISDILLFLIDLPSMIIVIVPLVFFLCISKSGGIMVKYIRSSFKKNYKYSRPELESISAAIKHTIKFTMGAGGFGFMVGLIACIVNTHSAELFLLNLSVSFISLAYAIAISFFVFYPAMVWTENKLKTSI